MDSTKKKTAISGTRMDTAISLCLNSLTDNVISMISQARLRRAKKPGRKGRSQVLKFKTNNETQNLVNKMIYLIPSQFSHHAEPHC